MGKYLTVQQYKLEDDISSADLPADFALQRHIRRAESMIDMYCGFDPRLGGFENGARFYQKKWDMKTLKTWLPNWPVPIARVNRYAIQVSSLSTSGAGFYALINTSDVNYNSFGSYIEITPLQSVTYSLSPVMQAFGLRPPILTLEYNAGFFLPYFAEILDDIGDHQNYWARRGFWATTNTLSVQLQPTFQLLPIPYVIYKNGGVISSGFTVDTVNGLVSFTSPNLPSDVITADFCATIPDNIHDAAIAQTTWLVGQRQLNYQQLYGLDSARTGEEQVKRKKSNEKEPNALCEDAITYLADYRPIAIG